MKNKACKYTTHIAQQKTSDVMEDACAVTFRADKCMRPPKNSIYQKQILNLQLE